ncbi:MAG: flagellar hook-basal body protein [Candidatus Hydrogenedentes bacterium]|nr:flagellar hook-basal body protein [Candidatus Hydrogenedentota bacterium]
MIQGLYAAAAGMIAVEDRLAVIANNVANAPTPGFRGQDTVQEGFYSVLLSQLRHANSLNADPGPGGGLVTTETFTDLRGGPITITGDPLNVALIGPGFLSVDTPQGERFTRSGQFSIDADGQLATAEGYKVLGLGGAIDVAGGTVEIGRSGLVSVDGQPAGVLRITEFEDPHMLSRQGHTLYSASDQARARSSAATDTEVAPNSLEMSNVQVAAEMAKMTLGLRAYSANQRVINVFDETMSRLINEVGAPV